MTAKMRSNDLQNRMQSIRENCADKRAWEGTRIGNLSRQNAVSLLGESVVAELDKQPFYVNCPQASDMSYTDPDASDNRNPEIEHYAPVACKDEHGRNIGTLIRVMDFDREHYIFDYIEILTQKQKIKAIEARMESIRSSMTQYTRESKRLATQLKRLRRPPKAR